MRFVSPESMTRVRLSWSWRLPADGSSVKNARDQVAVQATRCGADPDIVRLVVSELATNAIQHAEGSEEFVVNAWWRLDVFAVAVVDQAPDLLPAFNSTGFDVESTRGRGLAIVAQHADEVEVRVGAHCKAVCAVFRPPSAPTAPKLEPLAPIEVGPSEVTGYAYRMRFPRAYPARLNEPLTVHLTEAHASDVIPSLSDLRPLGDRITTLLAEGAALARRLDPGDAASLAHAFVKQVGADGPM